MPTPPAIRRGALYWLTAEQIGGPPSAAGHPHVVVQEDVFNRSRVTTTVVCALTSNLRRQTEPGNVLLEPGEGGLPRRSVVVVSQVSSVEKRHLVAPVGQLSPERVDQVVAGLRFQQRAFQR